ncbi:cephalosporin-C deacetylase [Nocardioides salarius]|uniref:Cephalosporin-C deacetylase n=1 Tax=Nocardioides salarius TaxID=374513 RepID=A0ABS2M9U7_9ACTN|nr:acetylxylan esterase [Nocardioides salarius]MBM7507967.1 cephalosporin-C deacetylase [Nocardioides salarius]
MPQYDLPLPELERYRSGVEAPGDLRWFWDSTISTARSCMWMPKVERISTPLELVDVYDVTFSGFGGDPVKAWYRRPAGRSDDLPVIVRYQGYTGGRGLPHQVGHWPLAGYAVLDVDSRGQGAGGGAVGDTADPHGHGPSYLGGFMTRGLDDPQDYYFRRLLTDAVLAVDVATILPGADASRICVTGVSQGGGIALAVAGLRADLAAVMSDVPFLGDVPRGMAMASAGPYLEVAAFLASHRTKVGRALATLAYVDTTVLVPWATAPALFSVALMDNVCPPSTVFAAHNAYGGPASIEVYPYNDHEGGQFHHEAVQLTWLANVLDNLAG